LRPAGRKAPGGARKRRSGRGHGTTFAEANADELRLLCREWPFFRTLVQNLEMTLAKSSVEIARDYLSLLADDAARWQPIAAALRNTG
jgi:phosphoenolpyruvate carboxylase